MRGYLRMCVCVGCLSSLSLLLCVLVEGEKRGGKKVYFLIVVLLLTSLLFSDLRFDELVCTEDEPIKKGEDDVNATDDGTEVGEKLVPASPTSGDYSRSGGEIVRDLNVGNVRFAAVDLVRCRHSVDEDLLLDSDWEVRADKFDKVLVGRVLVLAEKNSVRRGNDFRRPEDIEVECLFCECVFAFSSKKKCLSERTYSFRKGSVSWSILGGM